MARKPRARNLGGFHWVTGRCVTGTRLARRSRDLFLVVLARTVARHRWRCPGYAVLAGGLRAGPRDPGGQSLPGDEGPDRRVHPALQPGPRPYGTRIPRALQGCRGGGRTPLLEVCRAVALPPVRRASARKPGKWAQAASPSLVGQVEKPGFWSADWVAEQFGGKPKKARARFEKFVKMGVGARAASREARLLRGIRRLRAPGVQRAPGKTREVRAAVVAPVLEESLPQGECHREPTQARRQDLQGPQRRTAARSRPSASPSGSTPPPSAASPGRRAEQEAGRAGKKEQRARERSEPESE